MYRIEIISEFHHLDHFNWFITCGGYSTSGEELYVKGAEGMSLECGEADRLRVVAYAVTNTLPKDRLIVNSPSFEVEIVIASEESGEVLYRQPHMVNQWGGASITFEIEL